MSEIKEYKELILECDRLSNMRKKELKTTKKSVFERDENFLIELVYSKYPSIQACADVADLDRATVSKIIRKKLEPTTDQMIRIAKALGYDDSRRLFE